MTAASGITLGVVWFVLVIEKKLHNLGDQQHDGEHALDELDPIIIRCHE